MANSQKFRSVGYNARGAFVIDDIASADPWRVRCLNIRGRAEAILQPEDSAAKSPGAIIRFFPERIISWDIDRPEVVFGRRNATRLPRAGNP